LCANQHQRLAKILRAHAIHAPLHGGGQTLHDLAGRCFVQAEDALQTRFRRVGLSLEAQNDDVEMLTYLALVVRFRHAAS
jgi:hypothetical protein